jgi:hypothetical protein
LHNGRGDLERVTVAATKAALRLLLIVFVVAAIAASSWAIRGFT